jgi:hypothetical protein
MKLYVLWNIKEKRPCIGFDKRGFRPVSIGYWFPEVANKALEDAQNLFPEEKDDICIKEFILNEIQG